MLDSHDLGAVAQTLRVDATAAAVIAALDEAGIETILLKGSTHAFLARPGEHRYYVDVDLLVDPDQVDRTEEVLTAAGYRSLTEGTADCEHVDYGSTWVRDGHPPVDLHFTLPLARATPQQVWATLRADAVAHEVAGRTCLSLSHPARLLLASTHRAKSGPSVLSPGWDMERATVSVDSHWDAASRLADLLDAVEPFAAGLRVSSRGDAIADRLGLPATFSLDLEIRQASPLGPAYSVGQFLSTPGLGPRLQRVRYALVPSPALLRLSTPIARRGRVGLAVAYATRPQRVLWRLAGSVGPVVRAARRRQARKRVVSFGGDGRADVDL